MLKLSWPASTKTTTVAKTTPAKKAPGQNKPKATPPGQAKGNGKAKGLAKGKAKPKVKKVKRPETPDDKKAKIARIDPAKEKTLKSPEDTDEVTISIRNETDASLKMYWIDNDGERKLYAGNIRAGKTIKQVTFPGHYWVITDKDDKALGIYKTPGKDGLIVVK